MQPELEPVAVLADRLQAEGDRRGELLALELAAALASSVEESRRACREASALRAKDPDLAWPKPLWGSRGQVRAGLLVMGTWSPKRTPDLPATLGPWTRELVVMVEDRSVGLGLHHAANDELGLRLDGVWQADTFASARPLPCRIDLAPPQRLELPALGLQQPLANPAALRQLRGLVELRLDRVDADEWDYLLMQLSAHALRSLSLPVDSQARLAAVLDACPSLERLQIRYVGQRLAPHPGLERLRSLEMRGHHEAVPAGEKLSDALALPRLESLALTGPDLRDLERLAALGLRRLDLFGPIADHDALILALAELDTLEHLGLHWGGASPDFAPLAQLSRLRTLELGGWNRGELELPPNLQRIVFHHSPGSLEIRGSIPEVHGRRATLFGLCTQLDPSRVRTLGLSSTWARFQLVERPGEQHAGVETVVLEDDKHRIETLAWLRSLPSLRTVICPDLTIRQQRALSEELPDMQILGGRADWLRADFPAPTRIDPLDPTCWPKLG